MTVLMLAPLQGSWGSRFVTVEHYSDTETMQLLTAVAQGLSIDASRLPPTSPAVGRGFTAMMLLAVLVRIRIRDPIAAIVPAFVLMCLNLFLVVFAT
ncbi:MAG: hypothetical protein Q8K82_11545 [Gemmatimonadaceae bacterium]|nr:hypothetical protein [Gemmatimonadaceae bacterium]